MKKAKDTIDKLNSDDIYIDDIEKVESYDLDELLKSHNRDLQKQYTLRRKAEIENISVNISEFEDAITSIKNILAVYQCEYNDSINTIAEFDSKIKLCKDKAKIEELNLVREYYTAKVLIINNEIELKNTRITLIEKMIEFLKVKLENVNMYMQ